MKQTVTTTTMLKYILAFTILFSAFLALAITYNKVFKLKNESISIIEKYEGISNNSLNIINKFLQNHGYATKGDCNIGEYGVSNLDNPSYEKVTNENMQYYYCMSNEVKNLTNGDKIYYKVKFFYKFNIPMVGDLFKFKITGETKGIKYYSQTQKLQ